MLKGMVKGAKVVGFDTALLTQEVNDIDFATLSVSGKHVIYASTQKKLGNGSKESLALIKWFNNQWIKVSCI